MSEYLYKREYNLDQTREVAAELVTLLTEYRIWAFTGDLGSGKTTLIQHICQYVGYEQVVTSPTFSLVNEYQTPAGIVYHFDFYRIRIEQEALDMGVFEYFDSGALCLIEWPELIKKILGNERVIYIHLVANETSNNRTIYIDHLL